jgi:hypothetical protein
MFKPGQIIVKRAGPEPADEPDHFYPCKQRGHLVDKRDLGQVIHHDKPGHM